MISNSLIKKTIKTMGFFIGILLVAGFNFSGVAHASETLENKDQLIWFPIGYYTPETKIAAGLLGLWNHEQIAPGLTNGALMIGSYTQNKQSIFVLDPTYYFDGGRKQFFAYLYYAYFPNEYFGRLDKVGFEEPEPYTENTFTSQFGYSQDIWEQLYIRFSLYKDARKIVSSDTGSALAKEIALGYENLDVSGVGLSLDWDSRDYPQAPLSGVYHRLNYIKHQVANTPTNRPWDKLELEAKDYNSMGDKTQGDKKVLVSQVLLSQVYGDVIPFQYLNSLGGKRKLRGFFDGRYRDKAMGLVQVEWHQDFTDKFAWAVFAGSGRLAADLSELAQAETHTTAGFGVHYIMDPVSRNKIRLDLGFSKEGSSIYFVTGEAF
jgi:outer membrane protein assembly factor BamA